MRFLFIEMHAEMIEKLALEDFPGGRLRQRIGDDDARGNFVGSNPLFDSIAKFSFGHAVLNRREGDHLLVAVPG